MPRKSCRSVAVLLTASFGLFAGGCATPAAQSPTPDAQSATTPATAPTSGSATVQAPPDDVDLPASDVVTSGVAIRPATGALAEATPSPVSLDIAGTDIQVGVIDVGIEEDNEMEIPESFYEAGWYRYGPAPGSAAGNAVLAAHIDIGTEVMPFTQLKNVPVGTLITVGRENAEPVQYEVTGVRHEPKATLNTSEIFQRDGEHQLVIITCGGDWLVDKDDYQDNVVLTASPL
ncbi:class F sortase [Arthrobacter sp. TB 23]|uniref:class F sortase n=1 Tax=Arthrobacter sp. TB 23 TaxID=494419 RepID=UPI000377F74B|nr:class F sortase [Arthrobacter sp. TB 23]